MGMKFEEIPSCFMGDEWNEFKKTLSPNPNYDEILDKMAKYSHTQAANVSVIKDANIVFNFMDKHRRKTAESVVDTLIDEEDETINIDGYAVTFEPHSEKPGKIRHLVNGQRYGSRGFKTKEQALEDARKIIEIRKECDRKTRERSSMSGDDLSAKVASDFFKHNKRSGNPNSL
jgi:hypothetical protein